MIKEKKKKKKQIRVTKNKMAGIQFPQCLLSPIPQNPVVISYRLVTSSLPCYVDLYLGVSPGGQVPSVSCALGAGEAVSVISCDSYSHFIASVPSPPW